MKTETLAVNTATPLETQADASAFNKYLVMSGKIGQHRIEITISQSRFEEIVAMFNKTAAGMRVCGKSEAEIWITKETQTPENKR